MSHGPATHAAETADPRGHYDEWAPDYEHDLLDEYGYLGHEIVARTLSPHLPRGGAEILDAACGTGLAGLALSAAGPHRIDGIDISARMLARARSKHVYRRLLCADLHLGSGCPDRDYDAVVCVAAIGPGHLNPEVVREFTRVLRPGGMLVMLVDDKPAVTAALKRRLHTTATRRHLESEPETRVPFMPALARRGALFVSRRLPIR